jgi:hypothetical protein
MDEQWVAISRGGGSVDRPDEFRACGPFATFEHAEHWLEQEFGPLDTMSDAKRSHYEPQVIRIETPEEF